MSVFQQLSAINVNEHAETRNGFTYLSWAWAWDIVKKECPDASYEVWRDPETHKPYSYDEKLGYMVYVTVTIGDEINTMWLPVMNGANKAMKDHEYTYSTRNGEKTVEAATMFDVNKAIMRCLVKCLGMFGLGLYIYAGEDIPELTDEQKDSQKFDAFKDACEKVESTSDGVIGVVLDEFEYPTLADVPPNERRMIHQQVVAYAKHSTEKTEAGGQ